MLRALEIRDLLIIDRLSMEFQLIGIGLKYEWQQFIFGLLILPMVALYGRSPHIRAQV